MEALTSAFEPRQDRRQIGAETVGNVAAFLDKYGRQAKPADRLPDPGEAIGGDGQEGQRVIHRRIQPEGEDQNIGVEGSDAIQCLFQRVDISVIFGSEGQRVVEIASLAGSRSGFTLLAREKRIIGGWVAVQGYRQNIGAVVKDSLGAVAVMHVYVKDRHALGAAFPADLGGDR